jgi:hypothetical protein
LDLSHPTLLVLLEAREEGLHLLLLDRLQLLLESLLTLLQSPLEFLDGLVGFLCSSGFIVMMFLESISNKLPLPSAIVADESFFAPNGVTKKCVDARFGHTPKHLLMCGPQTSLAGLWISRPVIPVEAVSQTGLCKSATKTLMNSCPGGTPSGQEHLGLF